MNRGYELIKQYRQETGWDFEETLCVLAEFLFDARLDDLFHLTTFNLVEAIPSAKGKLKDLLAYEHPVEHLMDLKKIMGWKTTELLRFIGKFVAKNRRLNRLDQFLSLEVC